MGNGRVRVPEWDRAPCGCSWRVHGGAFVIRPCSPGCPVWRYARERAGQAGKPVVLRAGAAPVTVLPVPGRGLTGPGGEGHDWRGCRPVVLAGRGAPPVPPEALEMAWSLVPDSDRRLFHESCCCQRAGEAHLAAVARVIALVRVALAGRG